MNASLPHRFIMKSLTTKFIALVILFLFLPVSQACTKPNFPAFSDNQYYFTAFNQTGASLKSSLNNIIKNHSSFSYTPCVWEMLKEADADPSNPANVIGFYTRRSIPIVNRDYGGNTPDAWNREHIWAKSHGFPSKNQQAYTDIHHLRASDKSVNAARGNYDFADGGSPHSECTDCSVNDSLGTWEAPDVVKGDTARMMFYMAVRYEGSDNSSTPDLELVDQLTGTSIPQFGKLCDLVNWHIQDPVSDAERLRNNVVYSWQGNRNPFIDHPDFVISIWGSSCGISTPLPSVQKIPMLPIWMFPLLFMAFIVINQFKSRN